MSLQNQPRIRITDVLTIEDPKHYKLHLAGRAPDGCHPLDEYINDPSKWLGWNKWKNENRDDWTRDYIFSLMEFYPITDSWLFGGIFRVLKRAKNGYEIEEVADYEKYTGRLIISFHRTRGMRGRAYYLETYIDKFEVAEIMRIPYSGESFPGYKNIRHDFFVLEPIFRNERIEWKEKLQNVKGVYLICDKKNGKQYVGSAYGEEGIWSRWACYIGTGHGWNDELTKLVSQEGIEYARKNFRFSLLETMTLDAEDKYIIDRESYWKKALLTHEHGYNKN